MNYWRTDIHILCIVLIIVSSIPIASVADTNQDGLTSTDSIIELSEAFIQKKSNETSQIDFFFDDDCESCQKVLPYINNLTAAYPEIRFNYHNICPEAPDSQDSRTLFEKMKTERGLSQARIPIVFIGKTIVQGDENILKNLESAMKTQENRKDASNLTVTRDSTGRYLSPLLLFAAVGEGINPSVLLLFPLFLVPLKTTSSRRRMILVGMIGILAYLLTRLIIGIGVIAWVSLLDISRLIIPIGAILALIIGAIHIRDGISKTENPLLTISDNKRGKIDRYMKDGTVSAGVIVGMFLGTFGLISSGGIYLPVLGILSSDLLSGIMNLIGYNLVVILPIMLVLSLTVLSSSPKKVLRYGEKKQHIFRLLMGIFTITVGIVFLLPEIIS